MAPQGWGKYVGALEKNLIASGHHVTSVALGDSHSVLVTSEGDVLTWGWSDRGQLGTGDRTNQAKPVKLRQFIVGVDPVKGPRVEAR